MKLKDIFILEDIKDFIQSFFKQNHYTKIGVLVDENTLRDCYPKICNILPKHFLIEIKSGEENKNLQSCQIIWQKMTKEALDRKALLLNLGGGVIGDMGGFCASTYKRGIDFIQIPTTLLAQVDASVGGKLGIDFQGFKNHIGLFRKPTQVWIWSDFLNTLPKEQWLSGFAEIIKHALIADAKHWEYLKTAKWEEIHWNKIIEHSIKIKNAVVEEDFKESGKRKILNFGHTLGHAVETFFLQSPTPLLHGEAVVVGMILETYIALQKSLISEDFLEEVKNYIQKTYKLPLIEESQFEQIINLTLQDKKNKGSKVKGVLVEKAGQAIFDIDFETNEMKQALLFYQKL